MIPTIENRPAHCTRTRIKPFIDDCGCEWCEALDQQIMDALKHPKDREQSEQANQQGRN